MDVVRRKHSIKEFFGKKLSEIICFGMAVLHPCGMCCNGFWQSEQLQRTVFESVAPIRSHCTVLKKKTLYISHFHWQWLYIVNTFVPGLFFSSFFEI